MIRRIIFFVLAAFSISSARREAFVVNNLAETLSRIDLEAGTVQNHITVLGRVPNQVAYHNGYLYVVNSISANIQKIDSQSYSVVATISLPVGSNPYNMTFDNNYCYVTGWISGEIYRINLSSDQLDGEITIGGYPEGILALEDHIYAAQTAFNPNDFSYGQGQMAIINRAGFTLEDEINIGKNPQWINPGPANTLHIVCTGNYAGVQGSIYIYDLLSSTISDSILIGGQPVNMAISRDNIGYVAAGGWVGNGVVYSYNAVSHSILHGPANPINVGIGVAAVAVDSVGFAYSCNMSTSTVSKFDSSGSIISTFQMGDGPNSIVILDNPPTSISDNSNQILPVEFGLINNYPNPFNAVTSIVYHFQAQGANSAKVEIFDVLGRTIKMIAIANSGSNGTITWDGTDENGFSCASGVYFGRLVIDSSDGLYSTNNVIRMTLLK